MKKQISGIFLLIVVAVLSLSAQEIQRIKISERIPNISYKEVINYNQTSVELSDFGKKAIILNLWNTWCENGVKALLTLDSIQQAYPNDIQILNISGETTEKIKKYIDAHTLIRHIRLPNVVNDTLTKKHFPHWIEPLFIYIDREGIVKGISQYQNYKSENVTKLINGDDLDLPDDTDDTPSRIKNAVDPLISNDYPNRKKGMFSYSYVSSYQNNVRALSGAFLSNGLIRIFAANHSLGDIYAISYFGYAFTDHTIYYPSISIDRRDTKQYKTIATNSKDTYCFEYISRDTSFHKAYNNVRKLLDNSLGLKSKVENRTQKCWVFKEIQNSEIQKKLYYKGKGETYTLDNIFYCKNANVLFLLEDINKNMLTPYPIVNETGYRQKLTFNLPLKYNDREAMNKALNLFGLELIEELREIPVIVLEDE